MSENHDEYRISAEQRQLWRAGGRTAAAQAVLLLDGSLSKPALVSAIERIVERHEILRTSYHRFPGIAHPVQVVNDTRGGAPQWTFDDLAGRPAGEREQAIDAFADADRGAFGDAGRRPALRVRVIALGDCRHALIITVPALSADRQTLTNIARELADEYDAAGPAERDVLQYSQYAEWQHNLPSSSVNGNGHAGVREAPDGLGFPLHVLRVDPGDEGEYTLYRARLPSVAPSAVDRVAEEHRVRARSVCLAAWFILLWRITGQSSLTVGALLSHRGSEELADALGPYAEWAWVRAGVDADMSLASVATGIEHCLAHPEGLDRRGSAEQAAGSGRVQAAFELDRTERFDGESLSVTLVRADIDGGAFDLRLSCMLGVEDATVTLRYRADRFVPGYPPFLAAQYDTVLGGLLAAPSVPVGTVSVSTEEDQRHLVADFNATSGEVPVDRCFPALFAEQVSRTPDTTAIVADDAELTYRELDHRAGMLARFLRGRGVGPESVVAVCLPHSAELAVALLAVLKAGGAYAPIDPSHPARRVRLLLQELGRPLVLTDRETRGRLGDGAGEVVLLDEMPASLPESGHPSRDAAPDNLAYAIFTSGSTGVPKGVMISHRALANYLRWSGRVYGRNGGTGTVVQSSVAFDLTVTSLLGPLVRGESVRLRRSWQDVRTMAAELTRTERLNLVKITPSHLELLNRTVPPEDLGEITGALVVGGEALSSELVAPWLANGADTRVFNEYGPTEATVGCSVQEITGATRAETTLPIGRPMENCEMYVLDPWLRPVPVGMPGEIYIGGSCLARGYRGNPALTAERFVAHPFSATPGCRLYRSGDVACHRPDGTLQFLGRVDDQVKLRGVRVELGEIRAALVRNPAVRDAVPRLIDDTGCGPVLVAYLIASAGKRLPDVDLRSFLERWLPAHMTPDEFVWVPEFPLTANGKLDLDALSHARAAGGHDGRDVTPPRDDVERTLVRFFEELLGRSPVGADEGFFELGGHSMLAVQLIAKINAEFQTGVRVSALFEAGDEGSGDSAVPGSVRRLARVLRSAGVADRPDCLVPLGRGGTGAPIFCVHPAGGDVSGFRDLASALADQRAVYALQAPPFDRPNDAQSVEGLAARYIESVRSVRPQGPYALLGWSAGGLIAFEMAQRLRGAGEDVGALILVESRSPGQDREYDETETLVEFAVELGAAMNRDLSVSRDDLRSCSVDEIAEYVLDRAAKAGIIASGVERDDLLRRLHLYRAHRRAAGAYIPSVYEGPVLLVRAGDEDAAAGEPAGGWNEWCRESVEVHFVEGDHFSIMRRPGVLELAKLVGQATGHC